MQKGARIFQRIRPKVEKDELTKKVANLKARLKESESMLDEFELWAARERKASKELEGELFIYKKEVV